MGDVERALAFVARRSGRSEMPEGEWVHHLSLGLGWMGPADGARFVARAIEAGTLWRDGDKLRLTVVVPEGEIALGFRPRIDAQPAATQDPFAALLGRIAAHGGQPTPQVMAEVAKKQASMGGLLTAMAAALWVAAEAGLDVRAEAGRFTT